MPDKTPEATPPSELRRSLLGLSERHGVPAVDLAAMALRLDDLSVLPLEVARRYVVLPVLVKDDALFLAMADPADRRAIDEVEFVSGKKVHPFACDPEQLATTLELAYERHAQGERQWIGPRATLSPPPDPSIPPEPIAPAPPPIPPARPAPPPVPPVMKSRAATLVHGPAAPAPKAAVPRVPPPPPPVDSPRSEPAVAPSVLPSALPPMITPSGRTVVLVVGDDTDRTVLRAAFADLGHLVVELARMEGAVSRIRETRADLVVVDPNLPDGHGFDLLAELHALGDPKPRGVLCLLSDTRSWRLVDDLRTAYGVKGVLTRPIRAVEVLTRAESIFEDGDPTAAPEDNLSPQAEVSLQSGTEAYQRGELDEAIRFIEQGLRAAPGSYRLHYHHGLLLGRTGALHRAVRALEHSLALHGRYFPALRNLAVLYERAGFRRSALEAWERAHAAAPDDASRAQIKERLLSLL